MLVLIGNLFILSSITFGALSLCFRPKTLFTLQSVSVIIATLTLLIAFITSDFSVQNVLFYSSKNQPLVYKIAGLWASHNSSLLFWTCLFSLVSLASVIREYDNTVVAITARIFGFFLIVMMLIIYFTANPFVLVSHIPKEGLGLNPMLQDIAISIHPPMLYLGYVSYSVPFAYCLSMLIRAKVEAGSLQTCLLFSKIGLCALTSGIALGSWWAYRELGWGGYWFFDPVENISLWPWLIGIAMHHNLIISIGNGNRLKTTIFLGLINFILIIFGMMLVRSGSLASVHAFAASIDGGIYIISLFAILVLLVFIIYATRINKITSFPQSMNANEKYISWGSILLYLAALSVLIGTIFPFIYQLSMHSNITIDNGYFYRLFLPICLLIVALSTFVIFIGNKKKTAMIISHIGALVLVVGIVLNSYMKIDAEFTGSINDKLSLNGLTITLKNIRYAEGPNYYRQIAEFWVEENNETVILKPENRLYKVEDLISAESDIYSFFSKDLYAVLGSIGGNNTVHANIYVRPWMSLIWLGAFLMASGVLISLLKPRHPGK